MKKQSISLRHALTVVAVAITALFALAMPQAAFAADYGSVNTDKITQDPTTHTVTIPVTVSDDLYDEGYTSVTVTVDTDQVSNVEQVANKAYGPFALSTTSPHVANLKYTPVVGAKAISYTITSYDPVTKTSGPVVANGTYQLPYVVPTKSTTGASTQELGKTGIDIAPYAVAVVLLAGAGALSLVAIRQTKNKQ
ncbi:hypothetical protein [Bifidobacterium aquikefiricola]|uniref:Uncharacterized protein n=1 Tax=Bifidobacterium aquikefiricola TaxID=3059038 RepID=A0AB39U5A3_9BIFI